MEYEAVIGLETHVQLNTKSKMWCGCANQYGSDPNTNVCPVCLGLPGVLPVPNEEALRKTVLTGFLLNCTIPRHAKFDRKNYFYPDAPKNYQLTQYDQPSTANGFVEFEFNGPGSVDGLARVRITRAHLEEDVGKSTHFERHSGVDFNRAGVPLMEIVSEPDITSADMAYAYLNALTEILHQGGVSECDMEKGMVRCDVNISVRPVGTKELGAKIEIKNMNSFSGVRRALEYEIPRQIEAVKRGEKLIQSTRRWDDVAGITEQMRTKEDAHDYRYFPEPDLLPLVVTEAWREEARQALPELPAARENRFQTEYALPKQDAALLTASRATADYFEQTAKACGEAKLAANWVLNDLSYLLQENGKAIQESPVAAENLAGLIKLLEKDTISGKMAKDVLAEMFKSGKTAKQVVSEKGLEQITDPEKLAAIAREVIAANPKQVEQYRQGKTATLGWFVGQVMKATRGQAQPKLVQDTLKKELS